MAAAVWDAAMIVVPGHPRHGTHHRRAGDLRNALLATGFSVRDRTVKRAASPPGAPRSRQAPRSRRTRLMRALTITRPGGPEVLEIRAVPEPSIGPEEVLVRVRARLSIAPTCSRGADSTRRLQGRRRTFPVWSSPARLCRAALVAALNRPTA